MTTLFIMGLWVVTICGVYLFTNISFWIFAKVFGMADSYLQDRYWKKRGYDKMVREDGETWYVGYGE